MLAIVLVLLAGGASLVWAGMTGRSLLEEAKIVLGAK